MNWRFLLSYFGLCLHGLEMKEDLNVSYCDFNNRVKKKSKHVGTAKLPFQQSSKILTSTQDSTELRRSRISAFTSCGIIKYTFSA